MTDLSPVLESLEKIADRHGDPSTAVYTALFDRYPDYEALFVMDTDGGVRGSMLESAFDYILERVGSGTPSGIVLSAMRDDHEGYGVAPADFFAFFVAIRDTAKTLLSGDWSRREDTAWKTLLVGIEDDLARA